MTIRTPFQHGIRTVTAVLVLAAALFAPSGAPLAAGFLGARIAYDPPRRRGTGLLACLLVGAELLWGLDLGVLSLPFLAVTLAAAAAGRLLALRPWSDADGWRFTDALRSLVLAAALGAAITAGSVLVEAAYGNGRLADRFADAFAVPLLPQFLAAAVLSLAVLRRIDEPFRRPVVFSS